MIQVDYIYIYIFYICTPRKCAMLKMLMVTYV